MSKGSHTAVTVRKRSKNRKRKFSCHLCQRDVPYAWNCKCGFMICPECMEENKAMMSNDVIWLCPDCEEIRSF